MAHELGTAGVLSLFSGSSGPGAGTAEPVSSAPVYPGRIPNTPGWGVRVSHGVSDPPGIPLQAASAPGLGASAWSGPVPTTPPFGPEAGVSDDSTTCRVEVHTVQTTTTKTTTTGNIQETRVTYKTETERTETTTKRVRLT